MSKEVKLGLAIGGILLSVMLVYVLVVSGSPATPQGVALELPQTPSAEQPTAEKPAPEKPPVETAQGNPSVPESVTPEVPTTPPAEQPRVEPTPPIVASAAGEVKNDIWIGLLKEGMTESTTPTPPAIPAQDSGPSVGGAVTPAPANPIVARPQVSEPANIPPSIPSGPRKHTIQRGETYSSIATAAYGNASYFAHIIRANPGIDPAKLKPGMEIVLPADAEVRASAQTARTDSRSIDSRSEYRVQGNDSLYKISMKLYGKPDRMDAIYDANKASIGPDKAKLKVGAILKLPEAPTVASTQ